MHRPSLAIFGRGMRIGWTRRAAALTATKTDGSKHLDGRRQDLNQTGRNMPTEGAAAAPETRRAADWVGTWRGWAIWGSAVLLFLLAGQFPAVQDWLYCAGFLIAGGACLVNATRCGRRHCYFTAPAFLFAAVYLGLSGLHVVAMNQNVITAVVVVALLGCVSEHLLGRYVKKA